MLEYPSDNWKHYELLDSGNGEKLERFGSYVLRRPEPKAIWTPSMSEAEWRRLAHTSFTPGAGFGKAGKEDSGTWNRLRKMEDQWHIKYSPAPGAEFDLRLGLTSFKHVGVFPEQAPNWNYIYNSVSELSGRGSTTLPHVRKGQNRQGGAASAGDCKGQNQTCGFGTSGQRYDSKGHIKVLNLFAYTGAASLTAKAAGADVTHLDSVRQVVTWARGNMESSGLDGIRWVVEDAMKFAKREAKRGNVYDGIILDPPAYGHGPDGEKWKLDECLFEMLQNVAAILKPKDSFMVLNLYSNGFSAALGETVVRQAFKLAPSTQIESGELALKDSFGKVLPLSTVLRLKR